MPTWLAFYLFHVCSQFSPCSLVPTKPGRPLLPPPARILISVLAASHTTVQPPWKRLSWALCRCSWSGFLWGEPGWRQQRINWVFQLLIVEPFNILFHIRENKELKSIKDKIQNQPATFISWGTTSTTDKKKELGVQTIYQWYSFVPE